jgi:hypothetical protein
MGSHTRDRRSSFVVMMSLACVLLYEFLGFELRFSLRLGGCSLYNLESTEQSETSDQLLLLWMSRRRLG